MMELKDFVASSLTQIAEGIIEAQKATKGEYLISPPHHKENKDSDAVFSTSITKNNLECVEYDIAVSVSSSVEGTGKAKIFIAEADLNGSLEKKYVSRIKFPIYVAWPDGTEQH